MQKNDGTLVLQPTLTEIGKKRLLQNKFDITKIAVADDGVNYKLINENIIDPELAIKRTPVLSAWKDSSFNMNNKIIVKGRESYISEKDFNPSLTTLGRDITVRPKGFGSDVNFPRILKEEDVITVQYFITNNDISQERVNLQFGFQRKSNEFLVATLSESRYFDIAIEDDNVYRSNMSNKNFEDAFSVTDEKEKFPKVVNVYLGSSRESENSFYLHYKGNFRYDKIDTERYETTLTLMEESTGRFQKVKIQLIPTSQQTES